MAVRRDDDEERSQPGQTPGGGWVPIPDPTTLTDAAISRATEVFRREIVALRETIETRMDAADSDRGRMWDRLRDLPVLYETAANHLREDLIQRDTHSREVVTQRLEGMDKAIELAASDLSKLGGIMKGEWEARVRAEREFILSQIGALRDTIEQRLGGMDVATRVLASSVEKFPTDVDRAVASGREVLNGEIQRVGDVTQEKFAAVDALFASNALALAAALAAQEKAVAAQNDSNTLAISKSESSTKETIAANLATARTGLESLTSTVTDIKERVVRIESTGVGVSAHRAEAREERTEQRLSQNAMVSIIVAIVITVGVVISLVTLLHH
jgi:hypothetical protein